MSNQIETFICPKCSKDIPSLNKVIHMAQCKGQQLMCRKCGLELNRNEFEDHMYCHSLETQENSLQNESQGTGYNPNSSNTDTNNIPINYPRSTWIHSNSNNNHEYINDEFFPSPQRNNFQPINLFDQIFSSSTTGLQPIQLMQQSSFSPFSTSVSTNTMYDPVRGIRITTINNNGQVSIIRQDMNGRIIPEISEEMLNNLPERLITKADFNKTVNHQKECVVCLSNFDENDKVITLPCLHIFHTNCIKDWLRKGSPECPICKTTVNSNN